MAVGFTVSLASDIRNDAYHRPLITVWSCALRYCTLYSGDVHWSCAVCYCTLLYMSLTLLPYCTVLYCTVLYCTVLYCNVLYCSVLYCNVSVP